MKLFLSRFKHLSRRLILIVLALVVIGVPLIYLTLLNSKSVSASWYDDNWLFRKAVTVTVSSSASDITNLETLLTVDTTGITASLQTNCEDLRFTNQAGKLLPYYAPSCSDNSATNKVWILADLVPKNTTTYTMYMYYGNPSASSGQVPSRFNLFNGLVGYWAMNESSWNGTANEVKDSSVNTNHGVRSGDATTTASGKYSYAGTFDGTGDYVSIADNNAFTFTSGNSFTVSAWVYPAATPDDYDVVVGKWNNDAAATKEWLFRFNTSSTWEFRILDGDTNGNIGRKTTDTIPNTTWTHVVGTYDGSTSSTGVKIYINGVQKDTTNIDDGSFDGMNNTTAKLFLGALEATTNISFFNGRIDDARIYNRALPAGEVSQLYSTPGNIATTANATVKPSTSFASEEKAPGPSAYWQFDDGTGTTAQDSTTNNLDGTLNNAPTWTTEDQCMSGKCLYFDGTSNENVSRADDAKLDFAAADNFTLSAWVKKSGASTANNFILTKAQTGYTGYKLYQDASGDYCFDVSDGTNTDTACTSAVEFDDNSWHHVMGVKSGTTSITLYIDGRQRAQDTAIAATGTLANTGTFYIGVDLDGTSNEWLGYIDEVKIYPYARTAAQVLTDYNSRGSVKGAAVNLGVAAALDGAAPVGYWNFEEGSGTAVNDTSGNANTGTLGGDGSGTDLPTWATGKIGKSLKFDGSDDYVDAGDVSALQFERTDGFTIEAWIKTSSTNSYQSIFQKGNGSSPYTGYWFRQYSTSGELSMQLYDAEGDRIGKKSVATINNGTWRHVAVTYNGSSTSSGIKLYIDGNLAADTDDNSGTFDSSIRHTISAYIGKDSVGSQFGGSIDEVKVYNYARTAKQIVADMNASHPAVGSPVGSAVGYWKFDEGTGAVANNSGNGGSTLNGTLTSMASPATSTSGWTHSGKIGKALLFDGSDDTITVTDNTALNPANISISVWVNPTSAAPAKNSDIVAKRTAGNIGGYILQQEITSGKAAFYVYVGGAWAGPVKSDSALPASTWSHILATYDGTTLKIYINGKQATTTVASTGSIASVASNLQFGSDPIAGNEYSGSIDEVKVYNYALTADEVKIEYNRGSSIVLGASGNNPNYQVNAANQEYCVPGDSTSCAPPVAGWDFEEGKGTSANDTSGNANTGTLGGDGAGTDLPAWSSGKVGKGLNFDGTDDYVSMGDVELTNSNQISVSAWAKLGTTQVAYGSIVSKSYDSYAYSLHIDQTDTSKVAFTTTSWTNKAKSNSSLNDSQWHHLVGIYDGATIKLYVDGVLQSQTGTDTANITNTADYLMVGAGGKSGATNYFINGQIDDVKIFNYARTAAQIAWDYNKGAPVGHWKFDECQGSVAHDSAGLAAGGSGNNGTITIGASGEDTIGTCNTSSTAWGSGATGKRNASLSFDGTDDYVQASRSLTSTTYSISAWINPSRFGDNDSLNGTFYQGTASSNLGTRLAIGTCSNCTVAFGGGNTSTVFFENEAGTTYLTAPNSSISLSTWNHVTVTKDGANEYLYVNGKLVNSRTNGNTTTPTNNSSYIGFWYASSDATRFFQGQIDDVKIFNYALTSTQVKTLYNNGAVNFAPTSGTP